MSKAVDNKTLQVFAEVMSKITTEAVAEIEGAELSSLKKNKDLVSVDFLEDGERVDISFSIIIDQGLIVPDIVASVQERVIEKIQSSTKYRVHSCDVTVMGVNILQ